MAHSFKISQFFGLFTFLLSAFLNETFANEEYPNKGVPTGASVSIQNKTMVALENTLTQRINLSRQEAISQILDSKKIPTANLSPEANEAKALFDRLEQENKILPTLTNNNLQDLPVAIPLGNNKACYLAIKKAVFRATHVELEVYARVSLGDEEVFFGSKNIRYVMDNGFSGVANLALLGTQEVSNSHYLLQFRGGSASTPPNANTTFLKINCGNFEALVLKGKIDFNKNTFLPLDEKGYPVANNSSLVSSPIDFQTSNLGQLYIPLKNPIAFTLKKSQSVMGFSLKEAYIDLAETSTPNAISGILNNVLTPNTPTTQKQWTGLFAEKTIVYLPLYFYPATNKDPNPSRPSYESSGMVIDASGIYMQSSKSDVAKWDKMGGSPMTIDRIDFRLERSTYVSFSLRGKMGILLAKSPFKNKNDKSYDFDKLSPTEYLKYKGNLDDKSENFSLKIEKQESMNFMGAKANLRPDSQIEFTQDKVNYRSAKGYVDSLGNYTPTVNDNLQPTNSDFITHTWQGRLITPKISFRYIIGKGLGGKTVTHDTTSSNTQNLVTLGVVIVEDLRVGYSFKSKKPIFSFTRIGYEEMGKIPVFRRFGLRKLMAEYDEAEKICEVNFAFYANSRPPSDSIAIAKDSSSKLMVMIDMSLNFAMEVTDEKTEASFDSFSLNSLMINGSVAGFNVSGSLDFIVDDEEYGTACVGNLTAEFKIKALKKLATPNDSKDPARVTITWIMGEKKENDKKYGFTYFDGMLSFGELGPTIIGDVKINGFGLGVSVNMVQTDGVGSRYSLTGRKFIPKKGAGGFILAISFINTKKTQRGFLGLFAEFEKGGGYNGFRKLSIFGSWEFARDSVGISELTVQDAIKKSTNTQTLAKGLSNAQTYAQQVNNAVKFLDVPLDDKFAIVKFSIDFDCTTDDFIFQGNAYGYMHYNIKDDGSYVRGAADDAGVGFLGMISFRAQIKDGATKNNNNSKNKGAGPDYKDSKGYFWLGRPDEPLAIEASINVGKESAPAFLKFGATLFLVGGNSALPTNRVKYYSTIENAKNQINTQLIARGEKPIHWDLLPSVTQDGNGYFAFGISIGGKVEIGSKESAKVGVYFSADFGFGMALNYSQVISCNNSHFLGSAILNGSGELGLRINIAKTQTRFSILKGSFAIGGVGDGRDSYGAGMFEYSLLGGMIEGRAFGKFGAPFCLEPKQFNVNSKVNIVQAMSPDVGQLGESGDIEKTFQGDLALNEMIILKLNPAIAAYEKCNIVINETDTLLNVAIVANYALYLIENGVSSKFDNIMRWKEKRKNRQDDEIRFVGKKFERIKKRKPNGTLWWKANVHRPGSAFKLEVTLIITDDKNIQFGDGDRQWEAVGDFQQKLIFYFNTRNRIEQNHVDKDHDYYIRNL